VFQSVDSQNEWDGMFNGSALPEGIYYYEKNCDGNKETGVIRIVK
jgi:hypothetical protein